VPVARAGGDQTLADANGDGFELVSLDGSASSDPEGGALVHRWFEGGTQVATGATPTLLLAEGQHVLHLVVTDPTNKVDSDAVMVNIAAAQRGENRLANPGFEAADLADWTLPSGASITTSALEIHSGARALKLVQTGAPQQVVQRVAITPGTTYRVSGWLKTQSLTPVFATLTARVLAGDGTVLESRLIASTRGNSPYAYAEQSIAVTAAAAAAIELVGAVDGTGAGKVFFDDLRIRDRNLLSNGGFEARSPDGQDTRAPGWSFVRLGRVDDAAALAHAGRRSLVMAGSSASYHLVTQAIPHAPGQRYRLSAWQRSDGATTPATIVVRRLGAAGNNLGTLAFAASLSEGAYTLVERTLGAADLPAATASIQIEVRFEQDLPGTVRFDDFLLEALPD
jgi:hypothetical protein